MASQVKSRTQRRMEKKQTVFFLVLVLVVSLVSFSLGVMVGRSGAPKAVAVSAKPVPVPAPVPKPAVKANPPAEAAPAAAPAPAPGKEKLTFYHTLPKGKSSPMGSGINLPPGSKAPTKAAESPSAAAEKPAPRTQSAPPVQGGRPAQTAKATPSAKPVSRSGAAPAAKRLPASASTGKAGGSRVVQVASFRRAKDAAALRQRLTRKGYRVFVRQADLGAKGRWNRVYVGPFSTAAEAGRTAARLKAEEHLSALVKRR